MDQRRILTFNLGDLLLQPVCSKVSPLRVIIPTLRLSRETLFVEARRGNFIIKRRLEDRHLFCLTQADEASYQLQPNFRRYFYDDEDKDICI